MKAFYLSEENIYAECRSIGYVHICGDTIEYRDPEEAISEALERLSRCLDENKCSKGIILSGLKGKIKRISFDTYLKIINEVFNDELPRKTISNTMVFSNKKSLYVLKEKPWLQGKDLEIVINSNGLFLGVRKGKLVIIPKLPHNESLSIVDRENLKETFDEVSKLIPWMTIVLHALTKAYRRIQFSLETPPPISLDNCVKKGVKIECYKYRGSSRCIYNPKITCPLRLLFRKPPSRETASALYWIKRVKRFIPPLPRILEDVIELDKFISWFLISYIESLIYIAGLAIKEIMGIPLTKEEGDKLAKSFDMMQQIVDIIEEKAPKLGSYLNLMKNEVINITNFTNPLQKKTLLIITIDSFPYKIRRLSKIVRNYRTYLSCKPTYVSPRALEGYLRKFFPLLGKDLSEKIAIVISESIGDWGCVEPNDLINLVDVGLAEDILELLSEKNLLKKMKGKEGYLYSLR